LRQALQVRGFSVRIAAGSLGGRIRRTQLRLRRRGLQPAEVVVIVVAAQHVHRDRLRAQEPNQLVVVVHAALRAAVPGYWQQLGTTRSNVRRPIIG
jgi:predicted DNA-binding transcriptional regulator YafY